MPRLFLSYSWDDDDHKSWVRDLAARLRQEGIETLLDQWHLVPGDQLPHYMETSVRESDFALIICTPRYKQRADSRVGGVGYEGDIMTGEVFNRRNHRKFIPILSRGAWTASAPSWLQGKYYLDFRNTPPDETPYNELVMTILGKRPSAPPIGIAASIVVNALFANQDTLVVSRVSTDAGRGYSSFVWNAAYELRNASGAGVTISRIENVLPAVSFDSHELLLKHVNKSRDSLAIYEDFSSFTSDGPHVFDRLPYTFKPWTKVYIKVSGEYELTNDGQLLFCKEEERCYDLLTVALGATLNPDGSRPGIFKKFKTVVEVPGLGTITYDQEAVLLTPGCKINLDPLLAKVVFPRTAE